MVTFMRIESLKKYQRRNIGGPFDSLPAHLRISAMQWLDRFRKRWGKDLPPWRLAILIGQAKRLTLHPPTSQWGRSMHGKRGGHAVQRKYWLRGRHPTEKATRIRMMKLRVAKVKEAESLKAEEIQEAKERERRLTFPWTTPPAAVTKAHQSLITASRPNLPPPPSPEARRIHKLCDPPACRCYWCAWPNHDEP
jgi:hypothetical protein